MENKRKGLIEDNEIDHLLQQLYGFSDEQLLRDFKEMEEDKTPRPDLEPFPDEFDRIWEDIQAERAARFAEEEKGGISEEAATVAPKPRRKKRSWKRLAVVGLAACFLTLGCCFVAVGKKSYFYRERKAAGDNVVFNNDSSIISVEDQEAAYMAIQEKLGVKPLKLGYVSLGLTFEGIGITDRKATMKFSNGDKILYFIQVTDQAEASNSHGSDSKEYKTVTNKWLNKQICIRREQVRDVDYYEAQFSYKDIMCWVYGNIEYEEFSEVVERVVN